MTANINFEFNPLIQVVMESSKNEKRIRKEFEKTKDHFKMYPYKFIETILDTKNILESQCDLNDGELKALERIYQILDKSEEELPDSIDEYFKFTEDFLLLDLNRIYRQIRDRFPLQVVKDNSVIDILFYGLSELPQENLKSRLTLNKMSVAAKDFIFEYQMFYN